MLMKERQCVHVPDWLNAEMHPTGARGGYRFLLETPDFAVKLQKGLKNRPPIYVEMRAFGLHTHEGGELAACEDACTLHPRDAARRPGPALGRGGHHADTARCSRLDLYLDWQGGWHPDFAEGGDERHFVKRVHADVDRHSVNGEVTGFDIGKGVVRARIYNKSRGDEEDQAGVVPGPARRAQRPTVLTRARPVAAGVPAAPRGRQGLPALRQAGDERPRRQ